MAFESLIIPLEDTLQLEHVIVGTDQPGRHTVRPEHILFSIAVSAKRIADILEGVFETTDHHDGRITFMDLLQRMVDKS